MEIKPRSEQEAEAEPQTHVDKEDSLLSRSTRIAERMEQANQKAEQILQRQERLAAERLLGGNTTAGNEQQKPKEETPKEYADRVMAGGLN